MPRVKGEMVTCCRCSTSIFLKFIRSETLDGGYGDKYEKYEELPKEWMYETYFGYLCPKCSKEFQTFCRDFFPGTLAPRWTSALDWEEPNET